MKIIRVSVENETHRGARISAAETGTTVSAMMRNLLIEFLQRPAVEPDLALSMQVLHGFYYQATRLQGPAGLTTNRLWHSSER